MADAVLTQLTALKSAPIGDLRQKWRELFERAAKLGDTQIRVIALSSMLSGLVMLAFSVV